MTLLTKFNKLNRRERYAILLGVGQTSRQRVQPVLRLRPWAQIDAS